MQENTPEMPRDRMRLETRDAYHIPRLWEPASRHFTEIQIKCCQIEDLILFAGEVNYSREVVKVYSVGKSTKNQGVPPAVTKPILECEPQVATVIRKPAHSRPAFKSLHWIP